MLNNRNEIEKLADKRRNWVDANRENGFETGLKRLLTDLYPDNAHFIYELLQNAEDARAQEVRFILHEGRIEFEHDGQRLFSIEDVDAITSIGFSTKRDDATNIGKFGVGFKSVFAFTDTPEVESGEFHFRIQDMVVPKPVGGERNQAEDKQTRFVLLFNNKKKAQDRARSEIETLLRALDATTLLFLTHIRKIEYLLPDSSLGFIERIELVDSQFEIRVQQPCELAPSSTRFLKFDKVVQVEDEETENKDQKVKDCRIAVAFGLSPVEAKTGAKERSDGGTVDASPEWELVPMEPGRVCIYFPADKETSNLRFHIHAPFASTVARDSVRDCAGNHALRDHLGDLLAESMCAIRDQGLLTVRALALLPNEKDNMSKFYKPLMTRLVQEFKKEALLPMKLGGHASASGVFRGQKAISDLIDDDDMVTLLGDDYYSPVWVANPTQQNQREDNFISMLGIEQWGIDKLVKALGRMNDDARAKWMGSKEDEWHQLLYAILMDPKRADEGWDALKRILIVRTSDGTYRKGGDCYFPIEEVEHDERFPRVARKVYYSDKGVNKESHDFLKAVGVREVDERVEIEAILRSYYCISVPKHPSRQDHYDHLLRFMQFLKDGLEQQEVFQDTCLFMVDGEHEVRWITPARVYLDTPYMDTGLIAYYQVAGAPGSMYQLSSVYKESGIGLDKIGEFAKKLGAVTILPIEKTQVDESHPYWADLNRSAGQRYSDYAVDEDWHIPRLAQFLAAPSITKSTLVWRTMKESAMESIVQYFSRYGPNKTHRNCARSTLFHNLVTAEWVPQKNGEKTEFVRPREAVAEKLPEGFEFQTGWLWLRDLEFGRGVKERGETQSREQEQQTEESIRKQQAAKVFGFDSAEEAEEMARLLKKDPEGVQKLLEGQQPKPAFPEGSSPDPDRRKRKAAEKAADAPVKDFESRERSVRTSRTQGRAEVDTYLREAYTNGDQQLICQICQDEMPFLKKDGRHYFERVEAFDLPLEHDANYLALCPVCAAKYHEFVFHGPADARGKLRQVFVELGDALELPVTFGKEAATTRFVEIHAIDLRAAAETC